MSATTQELARQVFSRPVLKQEIYRPIDPPRADPKFRLLGAAFLFFRLLSRLDYLMFLPEGYKMIAKAEPNPFGAPGGQP
jgi:hypothetical protein